VLGFDDVSFEPVPPAEGEDAAGAAGTTGASGAAGEAGTSGEGGGPADGCVPGTCAGLGAGCGKIDDGCGTTLECGACPDGQTCGGGGPNQCGAGPCQPKTCADLKATCGKPSDGCSSTLDCGTCNAPETCGGGGVPSQCGCTKASCQSKGAECGQMPDDCGGTLSCGNCTAPKTCNAGKCTCTPTTCQDKGAQCGKIPDGCGGQLDCGGCNSPDVCGGDGTPNKCAPPTGHHETKTLGGGSGKESGGTIPVCCVPSSQEKADIMAVFDLLNKHRQANGRAPLSYDLKLEAAIEGHCHHMAAHPFFDHDAPESSVSSPWARASACGASASGENIAAGQESPAAVMQSRKTSPGHNANMLNGSFKRVGIGKYVGGSWGVYWGQLFGN
jgi:uncharacterized protein YkwD